MNVPNRNTLWAKIFVEELARSGLCAVSMAPGSRSTPLALAFAEHEKITVYVHTDERSAGFFALGMALADEKPVALLCTSGTATANFHPAVIEAFQSNIPIIVLTTDRPHEQRDSGANQTVDQVKMYGDHVRWFVDVAPPEADPPERTLRYLRTLACRAFAISQGLPKGPIHLNFPFRKPLEPTAVTGDVPDLVDELPLGYRSRDAEKPFTAFSTGTLTPTEEQLDLLLEHIQTAHRGLIVCGPRSPRKGFPKAVVELANTIQFPMLADALSGVRFGNHVDESDFILGGYEFFLKKPHWKPPDLVLRFGGMPVSKSLNQYLSALTETTQIAISENGVWEDATHGISDFVWADPETLCEQLASRLQSETLQPDRNWVAQIQSAEKTCWTTLKQLLDETFLEETILMDVVDLLPERSSLFVSNSLPVRHLDQFVEPRSTPLNVFGNRGASGIDGIVSSAVGVAAICDEPVALVTGDLAFFHDLNGLLALKRYGINITLVVINNDGGGIFHRLPISEFEPPFKELFLTPHGLSVEPVGALFGLEYQRTNTRKAFQKMFETAIRSSNPHLIEVPFDGRQNHKRHQKLFLEVVEEIEKFSCK